MRLEDFPFLSTAVYAQRFPAGNSLPEHMWYSILSRFRKRGQLVESIHWNFEYDGAARRYMYHEGRVMYLVARSERSVCTRIVRYHNEQFQLFFETLPKNRAT